jgi:hypothetical protein
MQLQPVRGRVVHEILGLDIAMGNLPPTQTESANGAAPPTDPAARTDPLAVQEIDGLRGLKHAEQQRVFIIRRGLIRGNHEQRKEHEK